MHQWQVERIVFFVYKNWNLNYNFGGRTIICEYRNNSNSLWKNCLYIALKINYSCLKLIKRKLKRKILKNQILPKFSKFLKYIDLFYKLNIKYIAPSLSW